MLTRPSRPLFFSRVLAFLIVLGLSATATADPKINQAKSSFRQGQRHFQAQKFTKALAAFEKAYSHVALAGFLFNIGQCHMELENYEKAASYFKLYIEKACSLNLLSSEIMDSYDLEILSESLIPDRDMKP